MIGQDDTEQELTQQAMRFFDAGDFDQAKPLFQSLCIVQPDEPEYRARLAFISLRQGDPGAAEDHLKVAVALRPFDPQLCYWQAVAVAKQQRMREARGLFEAVLAMAPGMSEAHNDLGHVLRSLGEYDAAERHFTRASEIRPDFIDPIYNFALSCAQRGDFQSAETWYRQVLAIDPDHVESLNNLAFSLRQQGRLEETVECYRHAIQVRPDDASCHANLAHSLENLHRLEEAQEAARRALELEPLHPLATLVLAQISRRGGDLETARLLLESQTTAVISPTHAASINAELGLIYDRLGDFGKAFDCWSRSNAVWRDLLGPERSRDRSYLDYIAQAKDHFTRERVAEWPTNITGSGRDAPVFLVGFPRSGTTLMEQLLDAHPCCYSSREQTLLNGLLDALAIEHGAGFRYPRMLDDLSDDDIRRLAMKYWESADATISKAQGKNLFIDKLPLNIIELWAVRRIFPDARVIVMLRDPRDACLSAYSQSFQPNRAMVYFLELERTAQFYDAVMGLWLHFRESLGLDYLEVRYEDLVQNFRPTLERVFRFLDVEWNDSVLEYHEIAKTGFSRTPSYQDITRPVYQQSVGRWRNYREMMEPVLPVLQKYLAAFDYKD